MTTPDVTVRNSALRNAESSASDPGDPPRAQGPATLHSAITVSKRIGRRIGATFSLPHVLAERQPSAEEIRDYARTAAYAGETGPRRALGLAWCHLVAVPTLVVSRVWAWTWQRPARAIVVTLTLKALSELGPVEWVADNVIKPGADFALWLFL